MSLQAFDIVSSIIIYKQEHYGMGAVLWQAGEVG